MDNEGLALQSHAAYVKAVVLKLLCHAALQPAFQPSNRVAAQQSATCCICGGSTVVNGRHCLDYLNHSLSTGNGNHMYNEGLWGQHADIQECLTGHAVTEHCNSTSSSKQTIPSIEHLLGMLVSVVDEVASNFFFGPYGTAGRPKGVMDISIIDSLATAKRLCSDSQSRWAKFLQQWQNAGWSVDGLLNFAGTIRPLQYRDDFVDADVDEITKEDLLKRIEKVYAEQSFMLMGQYDVEAFVDVVGRHFSKPDAVLLPVFNDEYEV